MKRFLVVTEKAGVRSSHGTALWDEVSNNFITSKPIGDDMTAQYFISKDGSKDEDVQKVVGFEEEIVPAPGIGVASIAPYIYRLEF